MANIAEPLTVDQFLTEVAKIPLEPAIIKGLLSDAAGSNLLICGKAGIGKSFLALDLAFSIATGTKWLDWQTNQKRVLFINADQSPVDFANRVAMIKQSFPPTKDQLRFASYQPMRLAGKGITDLIRVTTGFDLTFIDTMLDLVFGKAMEPDVARIFFDNLAHVQKESKTQFAFTHHIRKAGRGLVIRPENLIDEIKGPTEYVQKCDTVLLLTRPNRSRSTEPGKRGQLTGTPAEKALFLSKVKNAPATDKPVLLNFSESNLMFRPVSTREDEEQSSF